MNTLKINITDTDSFMYEIKTENIYANFSKDNEIFHFSNYSAKLT